MGKFEWGSVIARSHLARGGKFSGSPELQAKMVDIANLSKGPTLPGGTSTPAVAAPQTDQVSAAKPTARDVSTSLVGNVPAAQAGQQSPLPVTARDLAGQSPVTGIDPLERSNMSATGRDSFTEDAGAIFSGRTPGT